MRVLVFGDSITQGYWDTEGGWADKLRKHYDELQVADFEKDQPTIFNLGVSADTSEGILARIENETKARTRHANLPIVIVQVGVNDSSLDSDTVQVGLEAYKKNLATIINKMRPLSSKLIFAGLSACDESKTTPVAWGEYYYRNQDIKLYEDAMRTVAAAYSIPFIPVFDAFRVAAEHADLLPDGLHPNNSGHQVI